MRVDGLKDLRVYDAGDVMLYSGDIEQAVRLIEEDVYKITAAGAIPIILGGDHTIAWPDHTGVARHHGFGNVSMIHFDAHADTGDILNGSLVGHGTPMRRLIESGACAETGSCSWDCADTGPTSPFCSGWPPTACGPTR